MICDPAHVTVEQLIEAVGRAGFHTSLKATAGEVVWFYGPRHYCDPYAYPPDALIYDPQSGAVWVPGHWGASAPTRCGFPGPGSS